MTDVRYMPRNTGRSTGIAPIRQTVSSTAGQRNLGISMAPGARAPAAAARMPPQRTQDTKVEILQNPGAAGPAPIVTSRNGGFMQTFTLLTPPAQGAVPGQAASPSQVQTQAPIGAPSQVRYGIPDEQRQLILGLLESYAQGCEGGEVNDPAQAKLARDAAANVDRILSGISAPMPIQRPIPAAPQAAPQAVPQIPQAAPQAAPPFPAQPFQAQPPAQPHMRAQPPRQTNLVPQGEAFAGYPQVPATTTMTIISNPGPRMPAPIVNAPPALAPAIASPALEDTQGAQTQTDNAFYQSISQQFGAQIMPTPGVSTQDTAASDAAAQG